MEEGSAESPIVRSRARADVEASETRAAKAIAVFVAEAVIVGPFAD
jgi:hypothetical protein